mmetsp:Transcript_57331/g.117328  ORF Transcript_57331/g.117328 Transcript_57331/m.117328 type:complete len:1978 (-) Transcript_57331:6636-12569(-)|eukprot:CAMPEP_0181314032 /NCGR_PEP_ID=MMETSP1101-20121128/14586_1 /TAXON_ID=46948 /ORGANISM="Rhodomonas abbreviata, Strain Caron Lab Isolate" /LENGTH=1977 /DNA_ID=CAMNT_0023421067 /DNA_START=74 /DNA_END=6007 /DNA_ORIENTATION=-
MADFNWKSHKITKLSEYASQDQDLTLADYKLWRSDAVRNAKAADAGYILKMMDKIELKENDIPRLVDQSKDDDYASVEFMQHLVILAKNCGRHFRDPEPALADVVKRNYINVELEIQSFGAQIAAAAPMDKKDIFNQEDLSDCPFAPMLEWHMLYRSFNPHRGKDPTKYRDALNAAIAEDVDLASEWITGWMTRISNARTDLLKCESKESVDAIIIGPVINKFVEMTDVSVGSTKWQIKADCWHEKYLEDNKSISWMFLKQSILATADQVKKRPADGTTTTDEARQQRPKLAPHLPAAVALSATDRQDIYNEAFNAALAAFHANEGNRRSDTRQCFNCGKIGHIERFCRTGPQGQMQPRVSRWDRVGGLRGGGSGAGRGGSLPPGFGRGGDGVPGGYDASRSVVSGGYDASRGTGGVGGDAGQSGRGMGGGGGFGRGASADAGYAGRGRGTFGRGVPSRPLSSIVGQQTGMYGAEFAELPEFEQIDNTAFHAHIQGGEEYDRDERFREQVFGSGQRFGHADNIAWEDPNDSVPINVTNDSADPSIPNLPSPQRPENPTTTHTILNWFTFLPLTLEFIILMCRRALPTHLPRTHCATFGIMVMIIGFLLFLPTTQSAPTHNKHHAYAFTTFGLNSSTLDSYLVDSGCTTSIIADIRFLTDFKRIPPVSVTGLGGRKSYNWTATLTLPVKTIHGEVHHLTIENVYWDEDGHFNLISGHQVEENYKIVLDGDDSALYERRRHHLVAAHHPVKLPVAKIGRLYLLPIYWSGATPPSTTWQAALASLPVDCSFNTNCGSMSLEELFHLRMAHTPIPKLAQMSRHVKGIPRCLHFTKHLRFPCGLCQEAKAKRQPYPQASTNVSTHEDDLMTWDSFDMGSKHTSLGGNRYVSVFVIHRSRYAITLLHKDRSFETMKRLLIRAFARAGFTPKRVRHDGAGEYVSEELTTWLEGQGTHIWTELSAPHEQFGNAVSEKLVDALGKGIRTLLLQSELPQEFWGATALYFTDVYNHLPHSSLDNAIPHTIHTGKQADVSWFRPFGCRATIFRGSDLVEHHKLAPRGEQGVFLGLGMTHGYKSWVIYCPRLNRVFVSRNVTFDETLFPLRQEDQRVLGFYDNHSVNEMRADAYGSINPVSVTSDILDLPLPKDPVISHFPMEPPTPSDPDAALSQADTLSSQISEEDWAQEFHWSEETTPLKEQQASGGEAVAPPSGGPGAGASGGTGAGASGGRAGAAPAGEFRPAKRPRFSEAPPAYGTAPQKWWDCEDKPIESVSDSELAEFLIGHSITLNFPAEYWPKDRGTWAGQAFDTGTDKRTFGNQLCVRFLLTSGPRSRRFGEHATLPVSYAVNPSDPKATDVSIRRAIAEDFPHAVLCKDLTITREGKANGNGKPTTVKKHFTRARARQADLAAAADATTAPYSTPAPSLAAKILHSPEKCKMPALYAFAATMMLQSQQYEHNYVCDLPSIEPRNEREARAGPHCEEWLTAEEIELKTVWKMGTFEIVDAPPDVIPLPSRFTYKIKRDKLGAIAKLKARLVARGDMQHESEYSTTFAPTSKFTAIRTIISIATQENLSLKHWDIAGAFMVSNIDTEIYMDLPPGYHLPPGKAIRLRKSLYGLWQSPGLFHDTLEEWLRKYGFKAIDDDSTIFKLTSGRESVVLSLFVNDGLCATNSDLLYQSFIRDLKGKFELSDQGELSWYLGVHINHDLNKGVTTLNQGTFVDTMLKRFNMEGCKSVTTPCEPNSHLLRGDQPLTPDKHLTREYQKLVGGLMYLSNFTRPDISYSVNQCAKFMACPGPSHLIAAKRILRYLAGTRELGLTYHRSDKPGDANRIIAYADADHAGDPDSRRSVTGYLLLLNGGAVSWQSVRQQAVALSSAEAEYYAASIAGTDITYLRRLMEELGYAQPLPTVLYEDNMACIYMSKSSGAHHKVRHIDTRVYHLRDLCKDGTMELEKVESSRQAADSLTKGTPRVLFDMHRDVMLGRTL